MFSRGILVTFFSTIFVLVIAGREWLIHQEIHSLQEQLRSDMSEQVQASATSERLRHLLSAPVAFERFLEPVVSAANRMLMPWTRTEVITEWKREVHTSLDELVHKREQSLQSQFETELKVITANAAPGLLRLYTTLEKREQMLGQDASCRTSVQEEMRLMKDASTQKDAEVLALIRSDGARKLVQLRKNVKKMSKRELGEFLASGRFVADIEQPILENILKIKDTEIRLSSWSQYRRKVEEILGNKNLQLSRADRVREDKLQKLFDPVAEARMERETPLMDMGAPLLQNEVPRSPSVISGSTGGPAHEEGMPFEVTPENPSSAEDGTANLYQ